MYGFLEHPKHRISYSLCKKGVRSRWRHAISVKRYRGVSGDITNTHLQNNDHSPEHVETCKSWVCAIWDNKDWILQAAQPHTMAYLTPTSNIFNKVDFYKEVISRWTTWQHSVFVLANGGYVLNIYVCVCEWMNLFLPTAEIRHMSSSKTTLQIMSMLSLRSNLLRL